MANISEDSNNKLPKSVRRWAGKWALITGASAGIGLALAEQLAATGSHLVLTARRLDRLQQLATDLPAKHGVRVEVCAGISCRPEAPEEIFAFTRGKELEIDLLINNAGFGAFGTEPRGSGRSCWR